MARAARSDQPKLQPAAGRRNSKRAGGAKCRALLDTVDDRHPASLAMAASMNEVSFSWVFFVMRALRCGVYITGPDS